MLTERWQHLSGEVEAAKVATPLLALASVPCQKPEMTKAGLGRE